MILDHSCPSLLSNVVDEGRHVGPNVSRVKATLRIVANNQCFYITFFRVFLTQGESEFNLDTDYKHTSNEDVSLCAGVIQPTSDRILRSPDNEETALTEITQIST